MAVALSCFPERKNTVSVTFTIPNVISDCMGWRYKAVKKSSDVEITEEYIALSLVVKTKFPNRGSKLRVPKTKIDGEHGSMASCTVFSSIFFLCNS